MTPATRRRSSSTGAGNTESVARHGGRFIVRGGEMEVLEGDWDTRRIVVIEFPDMAAARGWYESEDYAPLKDAAPVGLGHQHHPRRRRVASRATCWSDVMTSALGSGA